MSKVIHLSDRAHHHAKVHCQRGGLKMSEWVAQLIDQAVNGDSLPAAPASQMRVASSANIPSVDEAAALADDAEPCGFEATVPRKKRLLPAPVSARVDELLPVYEAPPFWAR